LASVLDISIARADLIDHWDRWGAAIAYAWQMRDYPWLRTKCCEHPLLLGRILFPRIFRKRSARFHLEIISALMSQDTEKQWVNVIAPRGFAKTTLATQVFPLWHIFCSDIYFNRRRLPKTVLLVSKTTGAARNLLMFFKRQLSYNERLHDIFGRYDRKNSIEWQGLQVQISTGDTIVVRSLRQQVRGINQDGSRVTLLIGEDLEGVENTRTVEIMDQNLDAWLEDHCATGNADTKIVAVNTPQGKGQLARKSISLQLAETPGWYTLHYSAEVYDEGGKLHSLWEDEWPLARLLAVKQRLARDRYHVYEKNFLCRAPQEEGEQLLVDTEIRFWTGELRFDVEDLPYLCIEQEVVGGVVRDYREGGASAGRMVPVNLYLGSDPASSQNARSSYTAHLLGGIAEDRTIYLVELYRKRVSTIEGARALAAMTKGVTRVNVEEVAHQVMVSDYLKEDLKLHIPGLHRRHRTLPRGSGLERHGGLRRYFSEKRVVFRAEMIDRRWTPLQGMLPTLVRTHMMPLIQELQFFPGNTNDDCLSALYYMQREKMVIPSRGVHTSPRRDQHQRVDPATAWMSA
jgi:hypothetical protein